MGGRSSLHVRLSRGRRDIDLRSGEAYFEVASDVDRPFVVHAGDFSATAVGTAFEVRRGLLSEVAVTEGRVRASTRGGEAYLQPGQAGRVNADGSLQVVSFDPRAIGRWREQRASFRDAPLAQVIETLNRYHPSGVELADADLADMPITAAFRFDQMETALNALAGSRELAVHRAANGRLIVSRSRSGAR